MLIERRTWIGTCRSCGAEITWAATVPSGKAHPFNGPPITIPMIPALLDDGQYVEVDLKRSVSHFATCPHADKWRRPR